METITSTELCIAGIRRLPKISWQKSPVYFMLLSMLFTGCASFSDQLIDPHKNELTAQNLTRISGTYQLMPDLNYTKEGESEISNSRYSLASAHRYISKNSIKLEPSADLTLTVKVLKSDSIRFLFKKDYFLLDSVTLSAELQPAGMLFLKNRTVETTGVPYLFGGMVIEKTRLGLAKDDGLILDHVFNGSGALLFIFFSGHFSQTAYHFKRITTK